MTDRKELIERLRKAEADGRMIDPSGLADALEAEQCAVVDGPNFEGFGRAIMAEGWPVREVDPDELFEASLKYRLIKKIPGGYDPEEHIDAEGICPEPGDPWYEFAYDAKPTLR
ncbi:MAG: hypothetical protein R3235_09930, partial [Altererythrobacter ishigakiensis]|nr:hypothetical protein [Altererythrobacter ishigakiensis]